MAAHYRQLADSIGDNIQGQRDAERFIERLGTEFLDTDDLLRQVLLAQGWSPDRLRGFCRRVQKEIERRSGDV